VSGARLISRPVPARRRIAALLAVLAVTAAPGAALAQSGAGDDQYVDPIGGGGTQKQPSNSAPAPSTAPSLSTSPSLNSAPAQGAAPAATGPQLPRTGFDAGVVAAAGLALLLAGLALRRRLDAGH
jgi:LPXTG-motif cell wall-anchored protein